ncbi:hypothetical protein PHYPSEUDO_011488 [Phytophthora pseudosyringae]|uniref:Uncharacterized protein n=1 Tax=Phytophthora pseudosyringae TaxID=221518 RepID=A0A8T1VDG2_9STRA|nr:hypothetical protein PHYPSEUDO_011488 [Phytophthora pseudosyringae]
MAPPPSQQATFQELLQGGIATATHVSKKETRDVYASYFKKFCELCIANEYPDPATVRHHELPSLLVTFMDSVSVSAAVSNQTAEKIRAAVANYYSSHERRDAAGPDKWMVVNDDKGEWIGKSSKRHIRSAVHARCEESQKHGVYAAPSPAYFSGHASNSSLPLGHHDGIY